MNEHEQLVTPSKLARSLGRRPQVIYALLRRNPHLVHEVNNRKMVKPSEVMKYLGAPRAPRRSKDTDEDFILPAGFELEGAWIHADIWVIPDDRKKPKWVRGRMLNSELSLSRRRLMKLIAAGKVRPIDVDALLEALLELKKNHPETYNKSYQTWKELHPEEEED